MSPFPKSQVKAMQDVAQHETEKLVKVIGERAITITGGDNRAALMLTGVDGMLAVLSAAVQSSVVLLAHGGGMKPTDLSPTTVALIRTKFKGAVDASIDMHLK